MRPWQHVLEPLSGYVQLAEKLHEAPQKYSHAWNFGPKADLAVSVESLMKSVVKKWGPEAQYKILPARIPTRRNF